MFLASCGNADSTDTAMKSPVQNNADSATSKENKETGENEREGKENEKDEKTSIAKPASYVTSTDAKTKTIENMQAAFKGETTASAKYAAYSKKASRKDTMKLLCFLKQPQLQKIFMPIIIRLYCRNLVLAVPVIKPEFTVKSTKENLQDAIKGETYEVTYHVS